MNSSDFRNNNILNKITPKRTLFFVVLAITPQLLYSV